MPRLLARLEQEFQEKTASSELIIEKIKKLQAGQATYEDANAVAIEIGGILADVFSKGIQKDQLPDGRMYYNIARRIIDPLLKQDHEIVAGFAADVQASLNEQAKIGIDPVQVPVDQDRIDGLVNRLSEAEDYDEAKWLLKEPVKKYSQSIVDENIKANADRQYKAGLRPSITRTEAGSCCDWCKAVSGVYEYPKVPKDVYRRHSYCRCTVDYDPADGKRKRQNVHTKKNAGSVEHIRAQEELNEHQRKKQKADREKRRRKAEQKEKAAKQARQDRRKKLVEREKSHKGINRNTQINRNVIYSNAYDRKIESLGESKNVTKAIKQESRRMLRHRSGTKFEDLSFIDAETGKVCRSDQYEVENTAKMTKEMNKMVKNSNNIIAIHNHARSTPPSDSDIFTAIKRGYKYGLVSCHNGDMYKYDVSKCIKDKIKVAQLYNLEYGEYYNGKYSSFEDFSKKIKNDLGIELIKLK